MKRCIEFMNRDKRELEAKRNGRNLVESYLQAEKKEPFVTVFHTVFQDPRTSSAFYAGMTIKNLIRYIGMDDAVILRILQTVIKKLKLLT